MGSLPLEADAVVIGGGAAGMMAAGTAAERGLDVVLLEPNEKLGRKLRITGKGRCNVTNECAVKTLLENVPTNPKFLYSSATAFPPEAVMAFFAEKLGVPLKTERGNRVFPVSDNANDVADALARWLKSLGVPHVRARTRSVVLDGAGAVRAVVTDGGEIPCASAVIAAGGLSYPATGSTGDGYRLAAALGHRIIPARASLVPLESPAAYCGDLAGFAPRNVELTVLEDGKPIFAERGEMLFAHFGVTGPLVLSASAHMRHWGSRRYELVIDFKPALSREKLDERILRDFEKYRNRDLANALVDLVPRSMIPVVLDLAQVPARTKVHDVTRGQRQALGGVLKEFPVPVSGPRPVAEAIVTSGGVDVKQVDPRTMASKLVPGLYLAGEVLDVDGYTGGFNLQIAWATGRCAGQAVKGYEDHD